MKQLLMTVLLIASLASFGAIRSVTPDMYGGNTNSWQVTRHKQFLKNIRENKDARVVFIGDSITHFWETNGREQWKKYFAEGEMKAINLGVSADRTEHVLWRIGEGGELDGYEAKCVVLMIGTNNTGHFGLDKETPIDTYYGIKAILKLIAEKQPKARVILCSIFPRGAGVTDGMRLRNDVVNREIANLADGKKIIWCDFSDKFLNAEGRLSPELFPDLLHPNARGYEIWASSVEPLIRRVLNAKDGECIPSVWPSHPYGYDLDGREAVRQDFHRDNKWWKEDILKLHRENAMSAPGGEFDVVWVGDSITHRWWREGGEGRELWLKIAKQYNMLNLGIGGDKTQHVLWRLRNGELDGYKAKLFTVMIGTNNGGKNSVKDIAQAIKEIVELIGKKHPESKIVLMPIFPRADVKSAHERNRNVNEIIRGYADGDKVRWLDFNDRFLNAEGKLTKEVMNDLLHPNAKGYEIWWNAIGPVIKEITGK